MKLFVMLLFACLLANAECCFAGDVNSPPAFNAIVAVVNNDVVTTQELNDATTQAVAQAKAQGLTLPDMQTIERQVLQGLIMQKIALQLAKLNNITVSDDQVNAAIANIATQNHLSVDALYSKLASQGADAAIYQKTIRTQLIVQQLEQQAVAGSIIITSSQIDNYLANEARYANGNTEYDVGHILIALPQNPTADDYVILKAKANMVLQKIKGGLAFSQAAITYSDAGDALSGGDLGYQLLSQLPTAFVEPVSTMAVGNVVGPITTDTGYNIITLLGKKGGENTSDTHYVTEYHVEAILIKTSPLMNDQQVQAEMQRLQTNLQNDVPFAKLAEANSQDFFTSQNGGDMGWVNPVKLNPTLAAYVQNTPVGTLSNPFKTSDGWYLIQVLGTRQVNDTNAYLRQRAEQALFMQKASEALMAWQAQIKGASYIKILDPTLALPDATSGS